MKTVQKGNAIRRLTDDEADVMVLEKGWKFVPKSVWKASRSPSTEASEPSTEASEEPAKTKNAKKTKKPYQKRKKS